MASLHKSPNSPNWYCAYTDTNGRRHFRSTKTRSRKQAAQIAHFWQLAADLARGNRLSPDKARAVITDGVEAIFAASSGTALPRSTVHDFFEQWLEGKKHDLVPNSATRYAIAAARFIRWLGPRADTSLSALTRSAISAFRDHILSRYSANTARVCVRVLHAAFESAIRDGLITSNPAAKIGTPKPPAVPRRPFTRSELRAIFKHADGEWHGLCLFGYHTGQRLGDIAHATCRQFDPVEWTWKFTTAKTGRQMILPLLPPLQDYLAEHLNSDDPNAPLFQRAATLSISALSQQFYEILVDAGLAPARPHTSAGHGRAATRKVHPLSFHSFRHTLTSELARRNIAPAIAQAIIGHDSADVHRQYTHLDTDTLRRALSALQRWENADE